MTSVLNQKILPFFLLGMIIPCISFANPSNDHFFKDYSPLEKKALEIVKDWKSGKNKSAQPFYGGNGQIKFIFGAQEPSIICSILHVTDVAFETGEDILSVQLGDTARWNISSAVVRNGSQKKVHLFLKPLDINLDTNLIVVTNKRVYNMALKSTEDKYMPSVGFIYAKNTVPLPKPIPNKSRILKSIISSPDNQSTGIEMLDFNYELIGDAPWAPVRVYNNGKKTIIEMPGELENSDAPSLFLLKEAGGIFTEDKIAIVNYRILKNRYIVDGLFNKAVLFSGVGRDQEKIIIIRN